MTVPSPLLVAPVARPLPGPGTVRTAVDPVAWLLGLDGPRFAHQVSNDIRGILRPATAAALRDPRVAGRWAEALRDVLERVQADLRDPARRDAPFYPEWRDKAMTFRKHTYARLDEARALTEGGA
jgi:hypothetical protein